MVCGVTIFKMMQIDEQLLQLAYANSFAKALYFHFPNQPAPMRSLRIHLLIE